jgi:hypothetical protein
MLSVGSLVDPNVCLFIMGLSAQSVDGVVACVASVEYAFSIIKNYTVLSFKIFQ